MLVLTTTSLFVSLIVSVYLSSNNRFQTPTLTSMSHLVFLLFFNNSSNFSCFSGFFALPPSYWHFPSLPLETALDVGKGENEVRIIPFSIYDFLPIDAVVSFHWYVLCILYNSSVSVCVLFTFLPSFESLNCLRARYHSSDKWVDKAFSCIKHQTFLFLEICNWKVLSNSFRYWQRD